MWMLMGLVGLLVASSLVDLFVPADSAVADDADNEAGDDLLVDRGEAGDLLDAVVGDLPGPDALVSEQAGPSESADSDPMGAPDDGLPPRADLTETTPGANWLDDPFLSSDNPPQVPGAFYLQAGDDGDQIAGSDANDTLIGGAGDDWLDAQGGNDDLRGGSGNDTLHGGPGDDTLAGGDGDDVLSGGAGAGLLIGGAGNDLLIGGAQDDTLFGGPGDDTLEGGWGNDVLVAGEGNDLLMGGAGDDTLFGFTPDADGRDIDGADFLNGGDGDDVLVLGSGDIATGGAGSDTFVLGPWIDPDDPAILTDFDPAEDRLSIAYDAQGAVPEVTTSYDADARGLRVFLDGELVAFLSGVESLQSDLVTMVAVSRGG